MNAGPFPGGSGISLPTGNPRVTSGRPILPDIPSERDRDLCYPWRDCQKEFETIAENYRPPSQCPREEKIGSITPSAVCQGRKNVEIDIHAKEGETLDFTGMCRVYLQHQLSYQAELEVISVTEKSVTVELTEAEESGCIGFRGDSSTREGNAQFARTCVKLGSVYNSNLQTLSSRGGGLNLIRCNRERTNRLDVVPPANLMSLNASGEHNSSAQSLDDVTITQEACTNVTLSWRFGFAGHADRVDPETYIQVEIMDNAGNLVADDLPATGSWNVSEREDDRYTVTGVTTVDGDECGRDEGEVTIHRYHTLHLEDLPELQTGHSGELKIRSSCPALETDGIEVTLSCDHPDHLRVSDTATIPEGDDHVFVPVTASGEECVEAKVTADADDHLAANDHWIDVFDVPEITAVDPSLIMPCDPSELLVTGSCFKPGRTSVHLTRASETKNLEIKSINETEIVCGLAQGDTLSPGTWQAQVNSRGLWSNQYPIDVQVTPEIEQFASDTSSVWPCVDTEVQISFKVRNAEVVKLSQTTSNGNELIQEFQNPSVCDKLEGQIDHTAKGGRTYRLEAIQDDSNVTRPISVDEISFRRHSRVNITNKRTTVWTVWVYSSKTEEWKPTDVQPERSISILLENCVYYYFLAVNKENVPGNAHEFANVYQTSWSDRRLISDSIWIDELQGEFHLLGQSTQPDLPWTL